MNIKTWQEANAQEIADEIVDSRQCLKWAQAEIDELRAELAALKAQEPVARFNWSKGAFEWMAEYSYAKHNMKPLYLAAGAQERKPLTMIEMVDAAMVATADIYPPITRSQCQRIITAAAHGIKEQP